MAEHITAKYLASLARVGQQYGLKELEVGDIKLVFGGAPVAQRAASAQPAQEPDLKAHHDSEEIDYEALANDPRFIAFTLHGANPVAG